MVKSSILAQILYLVETGSRDEICDFIKKNMSSEEYDKVMKSIEQKVKLESQIVKEPEYLKSYDTIEKLEDHVIYMKETVKENKKSIVMTKADLGYLTSTSKDDLLLTLNTCLKNQDPGRISQQVNCWEEKKLERMKYQAIKLARMKSCTMNQ